MNGIVVRMMGGKNFGFIHGHDGNDYFFHKSDMNGFFDDLVEDVKFGRKVEVTFEPLTAPRGLRAREVTRVDNGV